MEDSPLGLDKWLPAMSLVASNRNGISSWELHRALGVTQKTAWFLLHRVRLAMQDDLTDDSLGGEVEVDETYIGGKARNMHKERKARVQKEGRNTGGKAIVLGMLERGKTVRATVVPDRKKGTMQPIVGANVEPGSQIYSDEYGEVWRIAEYEHSMVNHLHAYVDGNVHTNGMENFWSLLKRTIGGTYGAWNPSTYSATLMNRLFGSIIVCHWATPTASVFWFARSWASASRMPNSPEKRRPAQKDRNHSKVRLPRGPKRKA
jgi:hypothetical protein